MVGFWFHSPAVTGDAFEPLRVLALREHVLDSSQGSGRGAEQERAPG